MSPRSAEALRIVTEAANGAPGAHQGTCTCPVAKWADCECGWGELIDSLLRLAYGEGVTHETVARELPATVALARSRAAAALNRAVVAMPGSHREVAQRLGTMSTDRVKQIRNRAAA